jgi:hypothetical protein
MSDVRVPAVRLRTPSWRDARLVTGVLIVILSTVIGARVVAAAARTEPVYAAAVDLPSGHPLRPGDLTAVPVRLAPGTAGYLSALSSLPAGSVLMRPVGAGELVPTAALGPPSAFVRRPLSVPVPGPMPNGLRPGSGIDLWSSARRSSSGVTSYSAPVRIARAAEVYSVTAGGDGLAGSGQGAVQVLLNEAQLRAVLDALANDAKIAVVPVPALPVTSAGDGPATTEATR